MLQAVLLTLLHTLGEPETVTDTLPLGDTLGLLLCVPVEGAVTDAVPQGEGEGEGECDTEAQPLALALAQAESVTVRLPDAHPEGDRLTVELGDRLGDTVLHTDTLTETVLDKEGDPVAQPLPLEDGLPLLLAQCVAVAHSVGVALAHWLLDTLPDSEPLPDMVPVGLPLEE